MKANTIILLVLAYASGFMSAYLIFGDRKIETPYFGNGNISITRDTVFQVLPQKVINLKGKPKIKTSDSIKPPENPFELTMDTTYARDTISFKYSYPENLLSLKISSLPDTLPKYDIILYKQENNNTTNIWLERIGILTFGIAVGVLMNRR